MDDLDTMQDQANVKTKAAMGRMMPEAGDIQPSTYEAFKGVVADAITTFSNGQADPEMGESDGGKGSLAVVSEPCARNTMALAALFQKLPEGKPYVFDPEEALSSDAGMNDATATIGAAMKDKKLVAAAQAPVAAPAPAKAKDDGDAFQKPAGSKLPPKPEPKKSGAKDAAFYLDKKVD